MIKKTSALIAFLLALGMSPAHASDQADEYLGYMWQVTRLSSYVSRDTAPEIEQNLKVMEILCNAEKTEKTGKYMDDIINGFWFYAVAHCWSAPAETGFRLPARDGQKPTETSLRTAELLNRFWKDFSSELNRRAPQTEETLNATMKRLTGIELLK